MEFRVLGPLEVGHAGDALEIGGAKQRAVLALLILHAPEPVSTEQLIDGLWGERPPPSALHAVQVYISGIRKMLRGAASVTDRESADAGAPECVARSDRAFVARGSAGDRLLVLLSYIFFDRDHIEESIKLGVDHADKVTQTVDRRRETVSMPGRVRGTAGD